MSEYGVIYSSLTGNTEKIAVTIFQAIPCTSKDICKIDSGITTEFAQNYFIGFQVENGTAPERITTFIKQLHGKNVALFGTYGYRDNKSYLNHIVKNITRLLPRDNKYLGYFLCQGKMPISVRNKYNETLAKDTNNRKLMKQIRNFDNAMLHPNAEDEKNAANFVKDVINKMNQSKTIKFYK